MRNDSYLRPGWTVRWLIASAFALIALTLAAPTAFADTLTFNISPFAGSGLVITNGNSQQAKIEGIVAPGSSFKVNVTVAATAQGRATVYPAGVNFVATGQNVGVSPASFLYTFAARGSSTTQTFTITAPLAAGTYHVKFEGLTSGFVGSNFGQLGFTVAETVPQQVPTTLTLTPSSCCLVYHQAEPLTLVATLTRTSDNAPVAGKVISFLSAGHVVGAANTDANGDASIHLSPTAWAVGSYSFTAAFAGDALFLPSSTAGKTVSVRYKAVTFGNPISDGGTISGNAVPVKIAVLDANDQRVPDAIAHVFINSLTTAGSSVGSANVANGMRYDPTTQQYIFNWDAKSFPAGLLTIIVDLGEGACPEFGYSATRSVTVSKKK